MEALLSEKISKANAAKSIPGELETSITANQGVVFKKIIMNKATAGARTPNQWGSFLPKEERVISN